MSKSSIPAFLIKTYDILENPAHFDIISWNKEGTAFIVKNVNEFSEKILPKYFKHNNFSSFVRQLNMYDFHKSKQDSKENEFKHKLFRRGQKYLLSGIKRKGSDQHHITEGLLIGNNQSADLNKAKGNANLLNDEIVTIKSQQGELEKLSKTIYSQNTQLLNENKLLWEELNKTREKNDKKVEKLMMFIYSIMNHTDKDAISSFTMKNMLTNSESNDIEKPLLEEQEQRTPSPQILNTGMVEGTPERQEEKCAQIVGAYLPEKKTEDISFEPIQPKPKSPPLFGTPVSNISTLPNTPANSYVIAAPNLTPIISFPANFQTIPMSSVPIIPNAYNAQPYFPDNNVPYNYNNTSTTSGNFFRKENPKLTRPVPSLDLNETRELRENPTKMVKKDPEIMPQTSNSFQAVSFPSMGSIEDPLKFEEYPFGLNLSRGPSFNNGDLRFSRINSLNVPVPNILEPNYSQYGSIPFQNMRSNGENMGYNESKIEGVNCYSPNAFMRNGNGGLKEDNLIGQSFN